MNNKKIKNKKIKNENEFRNNVDLLYLTNPNNFTHLKRTENIDNIENIENINKYKSFILTSTKKLLENEIISNKVNESFKIYVKNLIEFNKFNNRKRIVQQQYKNINKEKKNEEYIPININQMDINIIGEKKTKKIDLNSFVKKKRKKKKNVIMPQKHSFN
jgi:hypothetical protein